MIVVFSKWGLSLRILTKVGDFEQYANYSTVNYSKKGNGSLKFRLINQRAEFAFALFAGGLSNPKLLAISNTISFADPKASLYRRLAQGKLWNEMSVTWISVVG